MSEAEAPNHPVLTKKEMKLQKQQRATQRHVEKAQKSSPAQYVKNAMEYFEKTEDENVWRIKIGFVPNMKTEGRVYASPPLFEALLDELATGDNFQPALKQVANVAALPGIIGYSMSMPDAHSGYGFPIGGVAATDTANPDACVSPGGVGFDINCGVRLLRTNLLETDVTKSKEKLADILYKNIPSGVGSKSSYRVSKEELSSLMERGMGFLADKGDIWPEDCDFVEEKGCIAGARASKVSDRAVKRGFPQMGTLGSGNHYIEVQVVEEIFDQEAADVMGIGKLGQVCVMIHSGSRGFGHQVCTEALQEMNKRKDCVVQNDRQLTGVRISSEPGQNYMMSMACAANFAFVNRSLMAMNVRDSFEATFSKSARDLDMHIVYDVCHNIAKFEEHVVNGETKKLLVHRKGATRAFGPNSKEIPEKYQKIGQPVIIGGSMGTCSYVLTGTQKAMENTFGSTCHGAGRVLSRSQAMREIQSKDVLKDLSDKGIELRVGDKNLIPEEAPNSYKDVTEVVQTCHKTGISKMCVKLRPICVIKG
eukprot:TRINITY_DN10863_c0_g1_i1.p1 TRINITY_DN10863_c0_g1~~TRINITY_DN10863_c0_g1_i1.p1  ORF type:complete len:536 (-),score=222.09 TRINITY_DN10863_c0_g1_i1:28-1635(-)